MNGLFRERCVDDVLFAGKILKAKSRRVKEVWSGKLRHLIVVFEALGQLIGLGRWALWLAAKFSCKIFVSWTEFMFRDVVLRSFTL